MAEKRDPGVFSDIVVAGAGITGGVYLRRWWKGQKRTEQGRRFEPPSVSILPPELPVIPEAFERMRQATQRAASDFGVPLGMGYETVDNNLSTLLKRTRDGTFAVPGTDVMDALLETARQADPTGKTREIIQSRMKEGLSATEVIEDLQTMFHGSSSIHLEKTIRSFVGHVGMLQGRLDEGRSIELHGLFRGTFHQPIPLSFENLKSRGGLADTLKEIESKVKGKIYIKGWQRKDMPGKELELFIKSPLFPKGGGMTLKVPLSLEEDPGIVFRGRTQSSKWIAGEFVEAEQIMGQWAVKRRERYEEWAVRRFLELHLPEALTEQKLSRRKIREIQSAFHEDIYKPLQYVANLPNKAVMGSYAYIEAAKKKVLIEKSLGGTTGTLKKKLAKKSLSTLEYAEIVKKGLAIQGGSLDKWTQLDLFPDKSHVLKVFPGASAGEIAENMFSLEDLTQFELFPGAAEWGARGPMKGIRYGYSPTANALEKMKGDLLTQKYGSLLGGTQWRTEGRVPTPALTTLYVSSSRLPETTRMGMHGQGSGLVSTRALGLLEQERVVSRRVSTSSIFKELEDLLVQSGGLHKDKWDPGGAFLENTVIGMSLTGSPVRGGFKVLQVTRHPTDVEGEGFLQLIGTKREQGGAFKAFRDLKEMLYPMRQKGIDKIAEYLSPLSTQSISLDVVAEMDELRKNRTLHWKQVFTALVEFTGQNRKQFSKKTVAGRFLADPQKIIAGINAVANETGNYEHNYALAEAYRIARSAKLKDWQMGLTFGAVPEIFGMSPGSEEWTKAISSGEIHRRAREKGESISAETAGARLEKALGSPVSRGYWENFARLSPSEIQNIGAGASFGIAQVAYGGKYGPGSGNLGSIEPRFAEILTAPSFGEAGPALWEDISQRMMHRYPERISEQKELSRSVVSLLEKSGTSSGVVPSNFTEEMQQEGGLLHIRNHGDVYIPSSDMVSSLDSKVLPGKTGERTIKSPLGQGYEDFLSTAKEHEVGKVSDEEMGEEIKKLRAMASRAQIDTITGKDSLAKGRLLGSRYLTAKPPTTPGEIRTVSPGEVLVPEKHLGRMIEELTSVYGKEQTKGILERLKSGEGVLGLQARHPFTSTGSASIVSIKMLGGHRGKQNYMVVGEELVEAGIMREGAKIDPMAARTLGDMGSDIVEKLGVLRSGPGVRMGLDYDADIPFISMLPNKIQQVAEKNRINYSEYNPSDFRMQLLKAKKAASGGVSILEAAAGASIRSRIQKQELGSISEALAVARAAVLSNTSGVSGERVENATELLRFLEEVPISAKNIAPGQEKRILEALGGLKAHIWKRNRAGMLRDVSSIVGRKTTGEQFMLGGARLAVQNATGVREVNVPGINVATAIDDIATAMGGFAKKGIGGISAKRVREVIRGRGKPMSEEEAGILSKHGLLGQSPLGGFYEAPLAKQGQEEIRAAAIEAAKREAEKEASGLGKLSREVMAVENKVTAAGGKLLGRLKGDLKPLAIGLGVLGGLSALFSGTPSIKSQDMDMPPPRTSTGREGGEGVEETVPENPVSLPPPPNTMANEQGTRVTPTSSRVVARGSSRGNVDYDSLGSRISSYLGGAKVNSRVVDSRKSLNSQNIAKMSRE